MKIIDKINEKDCLISFEVFPPKNDSAFEPVLQATKQIATLKPDFISVTYGAGGGTSSNTVKVASMLENEYGTTALAHLTCVSSSKSTVKSIVEDMKSNNIENILALRGDKIADFDGTSDYNYAYELINDIKLYGDFCIGAACYPEGHTECSSKAQDILNIKTKVDAGCDFLTTQMFFDNDILYNYIYKLREKGVNVPVLAGIMPVTNEKQIKRICQLSGTQLPRRFKDIVDKFGHNQKAMQQAGIIYASEQIIDLIANGVKGIHVYSMNNPQVAQSIMQNLSQILGKADD